MIGSMVKMINKKSLQSLWLLRKVSCCESASYSENELNSGHAVSASIQVSHNGMTDICVQKNHGTMYCYYLSCG